MPKVKGRLEDRPNVPSDGNKDSTCGKVHPNYSHGDGGAIRTTPQEAIYYCPEKANSQEPTPNPMHGSEFAIHLKTCTFCYHRLTKKMYHKK